MDIIKIKCMCTKYKDKKYDHSITIRFNLVKNGLISRYHIWCMLGENLVPTYKTSRMSENRWNWYEIMVMDTANVQFNIESLTE